MVVVYWEQIKTKTRYIWDLIELSSCPADRSFEESLVCVVVCDEDSCYLRLAWPCVCSLTVMCVFSNGWRVFCNEWPAR